MQDKTGNEVFTSFADYLQAFYPTQCQSPTQASGSESVGVRMARKSLELMRELLSDRKISCKRSQ